MLNQRDRVVSGAKFGRKSQIYIDFLQIITIAAIFTASYMIVLKVIKKRESFSTDGHFLAIFCHIKLLTATASAGKLPFAAESPTIQLWW